MTQQKITQKEQQEQEQDIIVDAINRDINYILSLHYSDYDRDDYYQSIALILVDTLNSDTLLFAMMMHIKNAYMILILANIRKMLSESMTKSRTTHTYVTQINADEYSDEYDDNYSITYDYTTLFDNNNDDSDEKAKGRIKDLAARIESALQDSNSKAYRLIYSKMLNLARNNIHIDDYTQSDLARLLDVNLTQLKRFFQYVRSHRDHARGLLFYEALNYATN